MSLQAQRAFSIHDPIVDEVIESGRKIREWHDNSDDTAAVNEFEQSTSTNEKGFIHCSRRRSRIFQSGNTTHRSQT